MLPFPFGFFGAGSGAPILFSDDFNRANGGNVGNGWVESTTADWSIASNRLRKQVGGTVRTCRRPVTENFKDGWVEVALVNSSLSGDHMLGASVLMRRASASQAGYQLRTGTDGQTLILARRSATDVSTTLDSATSLGLTQGDVIRLECIGSSLKGYLNGVEVVSATDSTYPNAGEVGVRCDSNTGPIDTEFDDFAYKNLDNV